jgi:XTP/dITP diphosphohydrolase
MRELLIGTRNAGKIPEIQKALEGTPFTLLTLDQTDAGDVEETGLTFEENAILKARTYGDWTQKLTLAEDSGLEVAALHDSRGVHTARYAPGTDEDRYRKLLERMKEVPEGKRNARFRAVVAIYDPASGKTEVCGGSAEGHIVLEPSGTQGFGYDPVFFYTDAGKTGAELTLEEKNAVSHRGRAMKAARALLLAKFV